MTILSKAGIVTGGVIEPPHVTQIVDALTASGSLIDILITGSLNVAGPTKLGTLGVSTQSPLVFNPDTAGASVFYMKNDGGLIVGTGGNPYAGGLDFLTFDGSGNASFGQNVNVAGNIAIGNTYPRLFFTDTDGNPDFSLINDNGNFIIYNDTNTRSDLFISSSGKIGIGTFNTRAQLEVANGMYTDTFTVDGNGGLLNIIGTNHAYMQWYPDDTTRQAYFGFASSGSKNIILENEHPSGSISLITNNRFVGINNYNPQVSLDVTGDTKISGSTLITSLSGVGSRTVTADATGLLSATSDSRLKNKVNQEVPGLDAIKKITPRAYTWKHIENGSVEIGFFADEVAQIIPSAAPIGSDGYYGFYDRSVIAVLVKAVQEQQTQIEELKLQVATLLSSSIN